jgi:hypothetical protein
MLTGLWLSNSPARSYIDMLMVFKQPARSYVDRFMVVQQPRKVLF